MRRRVHVGANGPIIIDLIFGMRVLETKVSDKVVVRGRCEGAPAIKSHEGIFRYLDKGCGRNQTIDYQFLYFTFSGK